MIFTETKLKGVFIIEPELRRDERGFFARTFCEKEFKTHGLNTSWVQSSISFNERKGILRGMHWQAPPHEEIKLVRCTMGSVYDVLVDMRPSSDTFCQWFAVELSGKNRRMLYVPNGLAHGFLTLSDDTEMFYQISEFYDEESSRGVRWNDVAFGVVWPFIPLVISGRDMVYDDFMTQCVLLETRDEESI